MKHQNTTTQDRANILRFLRCAVFVYLRPHWGKHILILLGVMISALCDVGISVSLKFLIDSAILPGDLNMLLRIITGIVLLFSLSVLAELMQVYLCAMVGSQIKTTLRLRLFGKLEHLPDGYYTNTQSGQIVSLFAREIQVVQKTLKNLAVKGAGALLTLGITAGALIALDWRMSLMVGVILPLSSLAPRIMLKLAAKADYKDRVKDAAIVSMVTDTLGAQPLIHAFGLWRPIYDKFVTQFASSPSGHWAGFVKGLHSASFLKSLVGSVSNMQQLFVNAVVIGVGAYLAIQQMITVGTFSTFIALLAKLGKATSKVSTFFSGLITAATCLDRIEHVLYEPAAIQEVSRPVTLQQFSQSIHFKQVSFSYNGSAFHLHNTSLRFQAGQLTAIVGRSGAGKTTILRLILRLYDPDEGGVFIDRHNLRQLSRSSLQAQIGVVLQRMIMLNASIRENIAIVKPDATDQEITQAARAAEIHDTIMTHPHQYDTVIGEHGRRLSYGQLQRIALARAVLRNPSILLLDEITASLDPETEAAINVTLKRLAEERTIVLVTHRIASIIDADHIIVMDEGKIVEQGTHQELLKHQGLYSQFWELQHGFIVSSDGHHAEISASRLRAIPLFQDMDSDTLDSLVEKFFTEYYEAGQTIVAEGDRGEHFYIVVRGRVSLTTIGNGRRPVQLGILQDGEYFGEIALMEGGLQPATVKTLLPTLLLTLNRKQFLKMLKKTDTIRKTLEGTALGRSLTMVTSRGRLKNDMGVLERLLELQEKEG